MATGTDAADPGHARATGFRLVRYFGLTSLLAFLVVAGAIYLFERRESEFFKAVQLEQSLHFARIQEEFGRQQEEAARGELLVVHEAGHVNLARVIANALWATHIAPVVARARPLSDAGCRALPEPPRIPGAAFQASARHDCFVAFGRRIMALPGFAELEAEVVATMRGSTVFKVKVFDLRGITVYSSEHAQIGEDKSDNLGWRSAARGKPASELTHRDRFSAFEGVVENRDLISTYVPVFGADGSAVVGVFEIYSDVTPFLEQIRRATAQVAATTAANQTRVERTAMENQRRVDQSSYELLVTVGALLVLLYVVLSLLVRNAQRIIDAQARAQEASMRREERSHREKMAALATMAASVAHEIGNPVATIAALAQDNAGRLERGECAGCAPSILLEQTRRIAETTRRIADFAASRGESLEPVDVNQMAKAVCDFLAFDRLFRATRIEFFPGSDLPACTVVPDHLTEALMGVLHAYAEDGEGREASPVRVVVRTLPGAGELVISIECEDRAEAVPRQAGGPDGMDLRVAASVRRVQAMGGRLEAGTQSARITLPVTTTAGR